MKKERKRVTTREMKSNTYDILTSLRGIQYTPFSKERERKKYIYVYKKNNN